LAAFDALENIYWLVVAANPSENYELVSWDDEIPIYYGK